MTVWCPVPDDDDDDMMSDWLDMVHKKNELVREESELIYRLLYLVMLIMFIFHSTVQSSYT